MECAVCATCAWLPLILASTCLSTDDWFSSKKKISFCWSLQENIINKKCCIQVYFFRSILQTHSVCMPGGCDLTHQILKRVLNVSDIFTPLWWDQSGQMWAANATEKCPLWRPWCPPVTRSLTSGPYKAKAHQNQITFRLIKMWLIATYCHNINPSDLHSFNWAKVI